MNQGAREVSNAREGNDGKSTHALPYEYKGNLLKENY